MNTPETVYYYIAEVNPNGAEAVLANYGFMIQNDNVSTDDIANALYEIVDTDGQPALIDVMSIHPDKTMILELFGNGANATAACCTPTTTCAKTTAPTCIPPLPLGQNAGMYGCNSMMGGKSFFTTPVGVAVIGIGIIATIALLKS